MRIIFAHVSAFSILKKKKVFKKLPDITGRFKLPNIMDLNVRLVAHRVNGD